MPSRFTEDREAAMLNRIAYWKRAKHIMEMHETKEKSINFRKKMLDDRAKTNYQNEYDQIRGALAHTVLDSQTRRTLNRRQEELKRFGLKIA